MRNRMDDRRLDILSTTFSTALSALSAYWPSGTYQFIDPDLPALWVLPKDPMSDDLLSTYGQIRDFVYHAPEWAVIAHDTDTLYRLIQQQPTKPLTHYHGVDCVYALTTP